MQHMPGEDWEADEAPERRSASGNSLFPAMSGGSFGSTTQSAAIRHHQVQQPGGGRRQGSHQPRVSRSQDCGTVGLMGLMAQQDDDGVVDGQPTSGHPFANFQQFPHHHPYLMQHGNMHRQRWGSASIVCCEVECEII